MTGLFKDIFLQDQIDQNGFVDSPFFTEEELSRARQLYDELHPDGIPPQMRSGIHMTYWCTDRNYKMYVREQLEEIVKSAIERIFTNFRCINPVFIVKVEGENTTFPIHQDWSIVDETCHKAYNVWLPLYDVDEQNGGLWMVKGSHKLDNYIRGAGVLFPDCSSLQSYIKPMMTSLNLKAGEAFFFYHRTIHGSPPNLTASPRVAISFSIVPKEAPLQICFQKDLNSDLEIYEPEDDFIYNYENVRDQTAHFPPQGKKVLTKSGLPLQYITPEMLEKVCFGRVYEEPIQKSKGIASIVRQMVKKLFAQ